MSNGKWTEKYDELTSDIDQQLKEIKAALKAHKKDQRKDQNNYGHAGDLANTRHELRQVLNFLNNVDEE